MEADLVLQCTIYRMGLLFRLLWGPMVTVMAMGMDTAEACQGQLLTREISSIRLLQMLAMTIQSGKFIVSNVNIISGGSG